MHRFLSCRKSTVGPIVLTILLSLIFVVSVCGQDFHTPGTPPDLNNLSLPEISRTQWVFDKFPILAWWAPPGSAKPEDFNRYKDAGFTIYPINPDIGFNKALNKAQKAGLDIMGFRQAQGFGLRHREVKYEKHKDAFVGWITNDEPSGPEAVARSIVAVNELMQQDPSRWTLFNMLPPFAQGEPNTGAVIDLAVKNGMPILSYDNYIMMEDGSTRERAHFEHLELFRRKSLQHDVPFWAFALTIKHFQYRRPSESDVRFKQFTNLAYGAKGLWYFTYWGPTDWNRWDHVAIVDPATGSPTELYKVVQDINHTVLEVGDVLLSLRSTAVVHTKPPKGSKRFRNNRHWISGIDARNALVGFFEDEQGAVYAMVVNKLHAKDTTAAELADTITLTFATDVTAVEALSWLDGEKGSLALDQHKAQLTIAGGTGVLLKATIDLELD